MSAKQTLLDWLAQDDLPRVLKGLLFLADTYKEEPLRNDATFQSGRWKALEKQKRNGTLSREEEHLQAAKIREALLHILQDLPDDWASDGLENIPATLVLSSRRNWKKYAAYITAAIALLAGIAEFSGYSLRDMFGKKEPTEQPATVLPPAPAPRVSTQGDQSPAIITHEGDVNINYGEPKPPKDSSPTTKSPEE